MSSNKTKQRKRTPGSLFASLAALVGTLILTLPAHAAEIEGVQFPEAVRADQDQLALYGMGLLRYRVVFRGYVGGLYLPADLVGKLDDGAAGDLRARKTGELAWERLPDLARALELRYFWAIEARFFGEAADELLERNLSQAEIRSIRSRLDDLNKLYRDVEEGDRYRLTYQPGRGTTLSYNGKDLGTVPGRDFADAYFSIWLGKEPISEAFRDQILRGRRPPANATATNIE